MRKICELGTGFDLCGPNIASVSRHAFSQPILNLTARCAFVDASDSFRSLLSSAIRGKKMNSTSDLNHWTRLPSVYCTLQIAIFYYKALHFPFHTDRRTYYFFCCCCCLQCYHIKPSLTIWAVFLVKILWGERFEGQAYLHVSMWLWTKLQNLEKGWWWWAWSLL